MANRFLSGLAARHQAMIGVAAFAAICGAAAVGALAIGSLAIGQMAVGRARIGRLEIDELVVGRIATRPARRHRHGHHPRA
jgi:hypothetical protein